MKFTSFVERYLEHPLELIFFASICFLLIYGIINGVIFFRSYNKINQKSKASVKKNSFDETTYLIAARKRELETEKDK